MTKRILKLLANMGIMALSVLLVFYAACGIDRIAGRYLTPKLWPGHVGLLFAPLTTDEFDMYDYKCTERINSLGFRDRETPVEKKCKYRVVAIGDSFTYGWGVNVEEAWCKLLEKNLRAQGMDIEVLNFGKPAAGPDEYAAIAETVIPILRPDLVIVGMLAGDDLQQVKVPVSLKRFANQHFLNLVQLFRYARYAGMLKNSSTAQARSAETMREIYVNCAKELEKGFGPEERKRFEKIEEPIKKLFREGRLNPWLLNHSCGCPDYFMNTLRMEDLDIKPCLTYRDIRRIDRVARRFDARTIVVSIPEGFYVNKAAFENVKRIGFEVDPEMLKHNVADEAVQKACERVGVPFFCATDEFRKKADEKDLYFELDRHLTTRGNALYAEIVTPWVAAQIGNAAKP